MKKLLLLVLLVVPCLAQNPDHSGLTITSTEPYLSIGTNLEEPSLEIEPLTRPELLRLDKARKVVQEANGNLAIIESDIAIHHGQSNYNNTFGLICGGTDTNVEVHGKYVFRTTTQHPSCLQFANSLSTIPVKK